MSRQKLASNFRKLYEGNKYVSAKVAYNTLLTVMDRYIESRDKTLKEADQNNREWYMSEDAVAVMMYVDLFATNLSGVRKRIDYLKDLGVTMIHFMPLLKGRKGENDGGYAVQDYKEIDPKFGTMDEFLLLVQDLRKEGIHTCIDFVVNHTAKEHEWAQKAMDGDSRYQDYYFMYDTGEIPKKFEETLPEVFPSIAPGNFTYYKEIKKYVHTTFYEFQWDLNYKNPLVFIEVVELLLFLANCGVDMIRLDAIPFMWKELGTDCRNHPNVHVLQEMFHAIVAEVCPSVALLGEAIVEPEEIVKYFGEQEAECDLMYNATFMVNIWNAIATRDVRLMRIDQNRLHPHKRGVWINYARCHDDIGWGFNEDALRHMGFDSYQHKQFLISYFEGSHPMSFSKGLLYEFNPKTMDARNSGHLASLVGLEKALEQKDHYQIELAMKRIQLIHALILSSIGLPLIYSGDELATTNNYAFLKDSKKAHDSRWLHRSKFSWTDAKKRNDTRTIEGLIFQTIKKLISIRKNESIFHSSIMEQVYQTGNQHIYMIGKIHEDQKFVGIFNFSEYQQVIHPRDIVPLSMQMEMEEQIQGKIVNLSHQDLVIGPYEFMWLKAK